MHKNAHVTPTARFDCVLFDAGGTLLGTNTNSEHWYEQFFVDACAEQGHAPSMEEVRCALSHAGETCRFERRCSTPEQTRTFWQHIYGETFRQLMPQSDHHTLADHYIERFERGEYVQLFDDTLATLELLRAMRIRVGVVSNFGTYLNLFLEKTGIAPYFDFVIVSATEGCEKPHPEIFDLALERAATPPARIMFVGDHPREDYEASLRHGCFPVLIDRHGRHLDKPEMRRVTRLTEIEVFLK